MHLNVVHLMQYSCLYAFSTSPEPQEHELKHPVRGESNFFKGTAIFCDEAKWLREIMRIGSGPLKTFSRIIRSK